MALHTFPVQIVPKVRCPVCRSEDICSYGRNRSATVRYYRCNVCCTEGGATKWKVVLTDPLKPE